MKLKELLIEKFEGRELEFPSDQYLKKDLEPLKEELLKCEEFMFCDDIVFMDLPAQIIDDTTYTSQMFKLYDDTKFKGKVYLYNLSLSPEVYDPNLLLNPVKNGAAIGSTMYDPMDFTPRKHILLTWNPEMAQDISGINKELTFKNDIHKLLDDVLENPEEYEVKGERKVLLRGVCETVGRGESPSFLVGESKEHDSYMGFYLEPNGEDKDKTLTLKTKLIPKKLKNKFIEKFTKNREITTATTEEIENFIKENTEEKEELSNRHKNALKNTFPDLEIQKEVDPQILLEELNDYLRLLADMDKIGIRRKLFLLEGFMNKVINQLKNK
jgi:hypothetical protein